MKTYGYMKNSELNLAEEVRQKYQISDEDMAELIYQTVGMTLSERKYWDVLKSLQEKYHLTDKHCRQLQGPACAFEQKGTVLNGRCSPRRVARLMVCRLGAADVETAGNGIDGEKVCGLCAYDHGYVCPSCDGQKKPQYERCFRCK